MNYRILGLIALVGGPFIFLKMALGGFTNNTPQTLILICDLFFYISLFASIAGLFIISTKSIESTPKYFLMLEIGLLSIAACYSLFSDERSFHTTFRFIEACRTAGSLFIIIIGSFILFKGNSDAWKLYLKIIASVCTLLTLLVTFLFPSNELLVVGILAIAGVISSLLGYHIYNSEDPEIVKDNMLYEVSSL